MVTEQLGLQREAWQRSVSRLLWLRVLDEVTQSQFEVSIKAIINLGIRGDLNAQASELFRSDLQNPASNLHKALAGAFRALISIHLRNESATSDADMARCRNLDTQVGQALPSSHDSDELYCVIRARARDSQAANAASATDRVFMWPPIGTSAALVARGVAILL